MGFASLYPSYALPKSWQSVPRDGPNKRNDMPFHFGIFDSQV
jgi:hypothetical protein